MFNALQTKAQRYKKITLGLYKEHQGKLIYNSKLYIPYDKRLQTHICEAHHILFLAEHSGRHKTLDLIRRNYYWPFIRNFIS